jgi:hypothetical protein
MLLPERDCRKDASAVCDSFRRLGMPKSLLPSEGTFAGYRVTKSAIEGSGESTEKRNLSTCRV